ncbi:hypothetical protein DSM25558_2827 [Agrobacterium sp. DSM 25558]|uniref:hypothetical protein n=1 Tax=Agrobacterium sp. DSM 25558 TaxID=1907665 RepID=UPI0009724D84|nr:hypothetical protein [Agrobacterium sp. DSM 25558]SCX21020.1 hypothetical protein DSM25558_2827 [Agrobacterium sp. DSM 25558]
MQRVFDLTAAAAVLTANPKAQSFIKAVRKFQSAISVSTDLADVKKSVEELQKMREDVGGSGHIARALLTHAVVVYCRASHTKAVERYDVGVIGAYSPEQREAHKIIVTLRDKVLAHFGSGGGWHDERVLYLQQYHGDAITAVHHRVNSDSMMSDILENLLEAAIPYVKEKEVDRAKEIDDELTKAPELFKLIDRIPFDVKDFYKDVPGGIENFWGANGFVAERTVRSTTKVQDPSRAEPKRRR